MSNQFKIVDLPVNMQKKIVPSIAGCWEWVGAKQTRGYGSVGIGNKKTMLAHRRAYELLVGGVPEGMTIDHLCVNKVCVNPAHLEIAERGANSRRKHIAQTHCKRGHELVGENLYLKRSVDGYVRRVCRECARMRKRPGGVQ